MLNLVTGAVGGLLKTTGSLLGGLLGGSSDGSTPGNANDDGYGHGTHVAGLIAGAPVNDPALSSPYSGIDRMPGCST